MTKKRALTLSESNETNTIDKRSRYQMSQRKKEIIYDNIIRKSTNPCSYKELFADIAF